MRDYQVSHALGAGRAVTGREQFLAKAGTLASIALATAGALALLVFCRFLYQGLSGQRRFSTWFEIVLYYLLPAGVAVLLFASLRLKPISKLRLLMSGVAFTASVYAVELFLVVAVGTQIKVFSALEGRAQPVMALLANSRGKKRYAADLTREFGRAVDIRTPREVIADLRKNGIDAIPILVPHWFIRQSDGTVKSAIKIDGREVIPLASVSAKVTLLCNENGQWIDYRSDSRGFNNPDEVWQSRRLEIAALGDSYAHGYCVSGNKNFVDLIRQRDIAILNLGFSGDGPLLTLATLKEYLPPLAPKIVLWFYYEGNDLTDLQTERRSALLRSYLRDDFAQRDLARQSDIDRAIMAEMPRLAAEEQDNLKRRTRNTIIYGLTAFAKLTSVRERLAPIADTDPDTIAMAADFEKPNMDVFREVLSHAKTRVEAWKGQLYFVYLPEWARYTSVRSWGKDKRNDVLNLVRSLGISIIDIEPVFQAHGDPLSLFPFRGYGHYAEAGHRLVAEEVLRRLPSSGRTGSRLHRSPQRPGLPSARTMFRNPVVTDRGAQRARRPYRDEFGAFSVTRSCASTTDRTTPSNGSTKAGGRRFGGGRSVTGSR